LKLGLEEGGDRFRKNFTTARNVSKVIALAEKGQFGSIQICANEAGMPVLTAP
jgi:hypothetical protein